MAAQDALEAMVALASRLGWYHTTSRFAPKYIDIAGRTKKILNRYSPEQVKEQLVSAAFANVHIFDDMPKHFLVVAEKK